MKAASGNEQVLCPNEREIHRSGNRRQTMPHENRDYSEIPVGDTVSLPGSIFYGKAVEEKETVQFLSYVDDKRKY